MNLWRRVLMILLVCGVLAGLCSVSAVNSEAGDIPDEKIKVLHETEQEKTDNSVELCALTQTVSGYCGGEGDGTNLTWTLTPDGTLIISGKGIMKRYDSLYAPWYDYGGDITSAVISDGVTSIGNYCFEDCYSLVSVKIPNSVTSIELWAFKGCSSLTSITIPDGVTSIEAFSFQDCSSLTNVRIPDSVTSIDWYAFSGCSSLRTVSIPDSVTTIGSFVFSGCSNLTSVKLPNCLRSLERAMFEGCSNLTSVTIPDSVRNIGDSVFFKCSSLTSIRIPDGVTSIGDWAFYGCDSLKNIYYFGTEKQWKKISIESYNDALLNAAIHFLPPAAKLVVTGEKTTTGVTASLSATNKENSAKSGILMYAVYDTNGKCLGTAVTTLTLTANEIAGKTQTIACDASKAKVVKVFFLTKGGYTPVCKSAGDAI